MPRKLHSAALLTACGAALLACGGMKDANAVADKFVDKYYVESDQDTALPLTTGVAQMRLKDELGLTAEARRNQGSQPLPSRQQRVYYSRKSTTGDGAQKEMDYELDIRPQGGGELRRDAHLKLTRQTDGTWRVSDFHETQK